MNISGRFRKRKVYYSSVSNEVLRTPNLSTSAKGLYACIQSYISIEGFTLYKSTLRKATKEGEHAFERMWKELKDSGYLKQYKYKDEVTGKFIYEYELLDSIENLNEGENFLKISDSEEMAQPSHSFHTPKIHPLDNPPSGKAPSINKYISSSSKKEIYKENDSTTKKDMFIGDTPPENSTKDISEENVDKEFLETLKILNDNMPFELKTKGYNFKHFYNYYKIMGKETIEKIIEYQASINTKLYAGFKKALETSFYACRSVEDVERVIIDFRSNRQPLESTLDRQKQKSENKKKPKHKKLKPKKTKKSVNRDWVDDDPSTNCSVGVW